LKKKKLFLKSWQIVARSDQVAQPGQFISGAMYGEPYIVARGKDGKLRAFFNICRHHANKVVADPAGQADQFVCCYHGWTYASDGRLLKSTNLKGIKDFNNQDFGLREIPLREWGSLVFINFGFGTPKESEINQLPSLDKILEPVQTRLNELYGGISNMKWVRRHVFNIKANWKIINDNYLDGAHHIPYIHPGLNSVLNMDSYRFEYHNQLSIQLSNTANTSVAAKNVKLGEDFVDRVGSNSTVCYAMIYPNFAINRYGSMMDTNLLIPISPNESDLIYDFFFENPNDRDFVDKSIAASLQVQNEDCNVCENVQLGMQSIGYDRGRYSPSKETATYHFHQYVGRALQHNSN